jgi:aryl-alcohol dehydrogenase-like predicted oxidoreductase
MNRIEGTDLDVFPLCLGGNVFTWTADADASLAVLDAYADAGGNFLDTADVYTCWVDGHSGGESEELIGRWHTRRGNRDDLVIATKVGMKPDRLGVSAETIRLAADESLRRLQTDWIDLYYAHVDDPTVPFEETLGALSDLVDAGKVRYIAASNYSGERLATAMDVSDASGLSRYVALQCEYNLVTRGFEQDARPVCESRHVSCLPYFGLAQGFLTGKYRSQTDGDSPRAENARAYLDERGRNVLAALDELAATHGVTPGPVALAWLHAQPTVAAVVSSARSRDQLAELLAFTELTLEPSEVDLLDKSGAEA